MDKQSIDSLAEHLLALENAIANRHTHFDGLPVADYLAEDFCEIGRSGRIYDKGDVLSHLASGENSPVIEMTGFRCRVVGVGVTLVHYQTSRIAEIDKRLAQRTSLWRLNEAGIWQMIFHQATPL